MGYELSWLKENRVAQIIMQGNVTLQEANQLNDDVIRLLDAAAPPIHFVTDITHMGKFPTNALQIKKSLAYLGHRNAGWFLIVGGNALVNTIATVLTQFLRKDYRMFRTHRQAFEFLAKQDATLSDLAVAQQPQT